MDFDHEIRTFIKVWTIAIASQCYCYYVAAKIPTKSMMRLISLLPILYLLLMLPLSLHSIHLGGETAFLLAYLAIFKLLLFAFDSGPLSPPPPRLLHFISIALLPINLRQRPQKPSKGFTMTKLVPNKAAMWGLKALVLCLVIYVRKDYREYLHPYVFQVFFLLHQYLALEIGYALSVALPQAMFGFELEPHFNEPYLSTSLQDLWGRRWNLVVSNTLRPLIHNPVKRISTTGKVGAAVERKSTVKTPAGAAALIFLPVMASFGISALMHELLFYYVTRARPSGEMMCFYLLHGLSLGVELKVKKALAHRVWIPAVVSGILTQSFLTVTNHWLVYPHLDRTGADARTLDECARMAEFVKANISRLFFWQKN